MSRVTYIQTPRCIYNRLKNRIKWKCLCTEFHYVTEKCLKLYDDAYEMHYRLPTKEQDINFPPFEGSHVIGHVNAYNNEGKCIGWLEIQSHFPKGQYNEEWFIVLEVLPEYRGQDVPEAMLCSLIKSYWFGKSKFELIDHIDEPILWYTSDTNHDSKHCAQRLGFTFVQDTV